MKLSAMHNLTKTVLVSVLLLMTASGAAGVPALVAGPVLAQPNNADSGSATGLGLGQSDPTPTPTPVPPLPVP
jgi:hypothetical protein